MDNAVQSEIAVINNIDLTLGDKDYYAALLANRILGGGVVQLDCFKTYVKTKHIPMVLILV